MASQNLENVIQRAISDAAFRRLLQSNPDAALRGFKLTSDEVAALRSGDSARLISFGIDQRMSKTFTMGESMNAGTRLAAGGSDLSVGGTSVADQDGIRAASSVISTPDAAYRLRDVEPNIGDPDRVSSGDAGWAGTRADMQAAAEAGRSASMGVTDLNAGAVRSAIHDNEPVELRGAADPTSELTARHFAESADTTSELTARHLASSDVEPISRIRDVAPVDLTGTAASADAAGDVTAFDADSTEAYAPSFQTGGSQDAFLTSGEATQYAGDITYAGDAGGPDIANATDIDVTGAGQGGGDLTGDGQEPELSP